MVMMFADANATWEFNFGFNLRAPWFRLGRTCWKWLRVEHVSWGSDSVGLIHEGRSVLDLLFGGQ